MVVIECVATGKSGSIQKSEVLLNLASLDE